MNQKLLQVNICFTVYHLTGQDLFSCLIINVDLFSEIH